MCWPLMKEADSQKKPGAEEKTEGIKEGIEEDEWLNLAHH